MRTSLQKQIVERMDLYEGDRKDIITITQWPTDMHGWDIKIGDRIFSLGLSELIAINDLTRQLDRMQGKKVYE